MVEGTSGGTPSDGSHEDPLAVMMREVDKSEDPGERVRSEFIEMVNSATLRSDKIYKKQEKPIDVGANTSGKYSGELLDDLKVGIVTRMFNIDLDGEDPYVDVSEEEANRGNREGSGTAYRGKIYRPIDPFCDGDPQHYYQLVKPLAVEDIERDRNWLYDKILALSKKGANIICANELAYPPFKFPTYGYSSNDPNLRIIELLNAELTESENEFRRKLQLVADGTPEGEDPTQPCVIVAGSYHDAQLIQNNAVLFFPSLKEPKIHQKLTTAKSPKVGEIIRTPTDTNFYTYDSHLGIITVLICLDAYDLNMFYRQLNLSQTHAFESPAIILVPALSAFSLQQACRELSKAARAVVIYANSEDKRGRCAVYYCGKRHFIDLDAGDVIADETLLRDEVNRLRTEILAERSEYLFVKKTVIGR